MWLNSVVRGLVQSKGLRLNLLFNRSAFHTIRQGFYTIKLKFMPNYLHFSKLIAIFADEFQVLLREGVRFNGSNFVTGAFDIILH